MKTLFAAVLIITFFLIPLSANEPTEDELYTASEFDAEGVLDALPPEVVEKLPGGDIFSSKGFYERFSVGYFLNLIKSTLSAAISPALEGFAATLALVLISSVLSTLKNAIRSDALGALFEFVAGLCIMLTLYKTASELVESVRLYISRLSTVVNAMVPVTVAIGTAGGNLTSASVGASGMMLALTFVETLASRGLLPVLQLCFGLSIASGINGELKLSGISKLVRGVFTWIIALISSIISAVMTFQTSIASHADSLSMRAVKFATSNAVPVVGGIAGDAVRTVAGSLSLVKSTVGWVGVILIAVVTLPVIINVLLARLGVRASETAAEILGLERERVLLSEVSGLYGFLAAVCVISALMFVYAMALFAKSSTAIL